MAAISDTLQSVTLGARQSHANLFVYPLLSGSNLEPGYLTLDEALGRGCARVTELSEAGSVPQLRFVNDCNQRVLLVDGEELVGAKQNRILNLTVLVAAHNAIVIPVSCVEAGRWHHETDAFSSGGRAHYASGRAKKLRAVSLSLGREGSRRSDQSEVWADISEKAMRMGVPSETQAAASMYETHRGRLDDYARACTPIEGQAGAVFAINGEIVGLDLFDSPITFAKLAPKLLQSYALDAIDHWRERPQAPSATGVGDFLNLTASARVERYRAIGLGEDLRLSGQGVLGGALEADGCIVHLCAFRMESASITETGRRSSGMARASARRGFRGN